MKYNDNGTIKDIYVKSFDTLPVGTEVDYDGERVPKGYVQVADPNTYSTEEVKIGKWIDGKPLYRKIIQGNIPTIPSGSTTATGTFAIASNIDEVFVENIYFTYSTFQYIPIWYFETNSALPIKIYVNNKQLNIVNGVAGYNNSPFTAIICYTKTTD